MTPSDWQLFGLLAILASNQVILRLPNWERRLWIFWPLQAMNLIAGCYLLVWGIPEFRAELRIVNWMIGLLFIYHTINHNQMLQKKLLEQRSDANNIRKQAIRKALRNTKE